MFGKKFWKKNFDKKIEKTNFENKYWKKIQYARDVCGHFNEVDKKNILIFFIVLVVLPRIKLLTRWNYFQFFSCKF